LSSSNFLLQRITPYGTCAGKLSEVKEIVGKLMKAQILPGFQVVATEESYYTDHGLDHIERVNKKLDELCILLDCSINELEAFLLLVAVYCHDLGMFIGGINGETYEERRKVHHTRSAEVTQHLNDSGKFHLEQHELDIVKKIIEAHRVLDLRDLPRVQRLGSEIRTRLLGALLRIADASDCDCSRAPRAVFDILYEQIPESSRTFWTRLFPIVDVHFDRRRSAIVVTLEREGNSEEIIGKHRSGNMVKKELDEELQSVDTVFLDNNIPLTHVDVLDFHSTNLIEFSQLPSHEEYILISLRSGFDRVDDLIRILEGIPNSNGIPLIIEFRPPEGPIFVDSRIRLVVTDFSELKQSLIDSLDDDFQNLEMKQAGERLIVQR
jgi:hypothetical protein